MLQTRYEWSDPWIVTGDVAWFNVWWVLISCISWCLTIESHLCYECTDDRLLDTMAFFVSKHNVLQWVEYSRVVLDLGLMSTSGWLQNLLYHIWNLSFLYFEFLHVVAIKCDTDSKVLFCLPQLQTFETNLLFLLVNEPFSVAGQSIYSICSSVNLVDHSLLVVPQNFLGQILQCYFLGCTWNYFWRCGLLCIGVFSFHGV